MPTYEYICAKCGHEFEKYQSMTAQPLAICPEDVCGKKKWARGSVKRKIGGGAGLIFKGTGFYITDYRSEGYKSAAKKDSDSAKPAATDSKPSTSAKPDAKSARPSSKK
jgi:putative FmdB family regulatory protein